MERWLVSVLSSFVSPLAAKSPYFDDWSPASYPSALFGFPLPRPMFWFRFGCCDVLGVLYIKERLGVVICFCDSFFAWGVFTFPPLVFIGWYIALLFVVLRENESPTLCDRNRPSNIERKLPHTHCVTKQMETGKPV